MLNRLTSVARQFWSFFHSFSRLVRDLLTVQSDVIVGAIQGRKCVLGLFNIQVENNPVFPRENTAFKTKPFTTSLEHKAFIKTWLLRAVSQGD